MEYAVLIFRAFCQIRHVVPFLFAAVEVIKAYGALRFHTVVYGIFLPVFIEKPLDAIIIDAFDTAESDTRQQDKSRMHQPH